MSAAVALEILLGADKWCFVFWPLCQACPVPRNLVVGSSFSCSFGVVCRCQIQQQYASFAPSAFEAFCIQVKQQCVLSCDFVLGWCIYLLAVRW
ncbi:hypothetical protein U1Q18_018116 [Sarracenia purpurea var. burkii]